MLCLLRTFRHLWDGWLKYVTSEAMRIKRLAQGHYCQAGVRTRDLRYRSLRPLPLGHNKFVYVILEIPIHLMIFYLHVHVFLLQINSAPSSTTLYIGGELAELGLESGYWSTEGCFFNPIPSIKYGGEDCETLYSYCSLGSSGSCSWKETEEYLECYQLREDNWFFTEKAQPAYTCRSQCNSIANKQEKYQCAKATKKLEKQGYARC